MASSHPDRVLLRPFQEGDAAYLFETYSDPVTSRYLARGALTDIAQAQAMEARILKANEEGQTFDRAVIRREDGAYLGNCTLFNWSKQSARAELGYSLTRKYWGQGYMGEALRSFVAIAFGELGMNRLEADIDPRNDASRRTLDRLGFVKEGFLRERWIVAGEVSDTAFYGLLKRDWRA